MIARVAALRFEHRELLAHSATLVERRCGSFPPAELREEASRLVAQVQEHRRRAGDLLFDVHCLDLAAAA